jgi:periplasmic glucans biosynthesis protein
LTTSAPCQIEDPLNAEMLSPSSATTPRCLRRQRACFIIAALACLARPTSVSAIALDDVAARALGLASESFQAPPETVPEWLGTTSYDQWRDIRFRPEQSLWKDLGLPFQLQLFHPGYYYQRVVTVNVVDAAGIHPLRFSTAQFDYGRNKFADKLPQDLGYAGLRLHAPIKTPKYFDEVIVFLGASYFRAVGKQQVFGLSARGLAIDTASPSGEEFPYFREFWVVQPGAQDTSITVYALLDSPSLAGAYEFRISPGDQTVVKVAARLFARREVRKLGMAPLTSMFFHGENTSRAFDDFRPEAHDSDGLLLNFASGEWMWRPLDNPRALNVSTFNMPSPHGFGLVQRDRDFTHYQDLETRFDVRPSAWVVPDGFWGDGKAELVEIPTKADANDNIVAYWVPDKGPVPGKPFDFGYTLYWYGDGNPEPPGRVIATRRDRGNVENAYRFVIDFAGRKLEALPAETILRAVVSIASGPDAAELLDQHVEKNPTTGGFRLTFQVRPLTKEPIELRAFLDKDANTLTETWSYVLLQ